MEELLTSLTTQFPILATIYTGLSGAYLIFCAVATITSTKADDDIKDKLKQFFSIKK